MVKNNEEVIAALVRLADTLDQEGKSDLAESVDGTLEAFAARPKAPLKSLDENVKKNLISFLYNAFNNLESSISGLEEMFKRLRYFGVDSIIGDLKMSRTLDEMKSLHIEVAAITDKFYEFTKGKKPRGDDVKNMAAADGQVAQDASDFFAAQKPSNEVKESDIVNRDETGERVPVLSDDVSCQDCGETMNIGVLHSAAGFYLGRECKCGPYSRESKYYKTEQEAQKALAELMGTSAPTETKEPEEETSIEDFWKDYSSTDKSE